MKTEEIPVTILTGFLGAGKTTYLNLLLARDAPRGSLILVNDFGDINIDAELIDYSDESILRLSNGCICCTLGGSLAEQLAKYLRMEVHPAAIFIEASGISNPSRIVDTVTISPRLYMQEVVCLVDASQVIRHTADPRVVDVWCNQIRVADRLLVNRHRLDQDHSQLIVELRDMAEQKLKNETSRFPMPTLAAGKRPFANFDHKQTQSHTARWQSCSFSYNSLIDGLRLEELIRQYEDVLVRAKGILHRSGSSGMEVFQFSGDDIRWQSLVRRLGKGQLVCLGFKGKRFTELQGELKSLEHDMT